MKPVDLTFSFDETGSMRPCTHEVRAGIKKVALELFRTYPDLRIGLIAHGDYCDERTYITKHLGFTNNPETLVRFLETLPSVSGGDEPEAYEMVLHEARELNWRTDAEKVLIMVGDEVPHGFHGHDKQARYHWERELEHLFQENVTVHGVQCLNKKHATPFYKKLANVTGGRHLTLQQFSDILHLINMVAYYQNAQLDQYVDQVHEKGGLTRSLKQLFAQFRAEDWEHRIETDLSLHAVSPFRFQVLTVGTSAVGIKEFVQNSGARFKIGRGFYEFTKSETIQHYKEIVLRDRKTGDMFTGTKARELAGIPHGVTARVKPTILTQYQVFVQSTSPNRKLMPNTKFLYEVEELAE